MAISLQQAYRACLWIAEQELDISWNERRGSIDLIEPEIPVGDFQWSRIELVRSLPLDHFNLSCYHQPKLGEEEGGSVDEGNVYSYQLENDCDCFDASNFLDGDLFIAEDMSFWDRYSPNRDRPFLSRKYSSSESMTVIPDEIEQASLISIESNNSAKADIKAHELLADLLTTNTITATGHETIVHRDEQPTLHHYVQELADVNDCVELTTQLWKTKVIPNYEWSALEVGLERDKYLSEIAKRKSIDPSAEGFEEFQNYAAGCEVWFTNITVSENFLEWLKRTWKELHALPEEAIYKLNNKGGYTLQFGSDPAVDLKNSKLAKLLYSLLRYHRYEKQPECFLGATGNDVDRVEETEDLENELNSEIPGTGLDNGDIQRFNFRSEQDATSQAQKCCNLIYFKIANYLQSISNDSKIEHTTLLKSTRKLITKLDDLRSKYPGADVPDSSTIKLLLEHPREIKESNLEVIREILKVEPMRAEYRVDQALKKQAQRLVKLLKENSPELANHLGQSELKSEAGIGYTHDGGFYIVSPKSIKWDFGDN